jgi:dTDP-4-dehydrorhamnose reductase
MEKILITGAAGFLGSRVVDFYRGNYEVYAPAHGELDITDAKAAVQVAGRFQPDIIIHCAAISDVGQCEREPEKSWDINVTGSINIAKAAKGISAACILCSSDQVYFGAGPARAHYGEEGLCPAHSHREEEELCPANVYGREKLKAEQECLEANPDCVLLRLSWMYDAKVRKPGEHGDLFRTLLPQIRDEGGISFPVHDRRGITDIAEVVKNLEKTFRLPGGVYNFGSPNQKDTYHTFQEVFSGAGIDVGRLQKNEEAFRTNPRNLAMSQEKINRHGIFFSSTIEGLSRNLSCALERGI